MNYDNTNQLGHIARSNSLLIGCGTTEQLLEIIQEFLGEYSYAGVVKIFSTNFTKSVNIKKGLTQLKIKEILEKSSPSLSVQKIGEYLLIRDELIIVIIHCQSPECVDTLQDNITYFVDAITLWLKRNNINQSTSASLNQLTDSITFSMTEVQGLTDQLSSKGKSLINNIINLSFDQISMLDIDEYEEDKLKSLFLDCSDTFSNFLNDIHSFTAGLNQYLSKTKTVVFKQTAALDDLENMLSNHKDDYQDILF